MGPDLPVHASLENVKIDIFLTLLVKPAEIPYASFAPAAEMSLCLPETAFVFA